VSILLVEDKDSLRAMLRAALEDQGHAVVEARDQAEAMERLQDSRPELVLSDLRLTSGDGFGVLKAAKELDPNLPVVVMTAYGSIQDAVQAMREGALDFLANPSIWTISSCSWRARSPVADWPPRTSCSRKKWRGAAARRRSSATTRL
jgi:DNA-binding NtrC family response regulator